MRTKLVFTVIVLYLCCILSGCDKTETKQAATAEQNTRFDYHIENVIAFKEKDGNIWVSTEGTSLISCYDENGKRINELDLGEGEHTSLNICGEDLIAFTYTEHAPYITQYDMGTGELVTNELPTDITGAISMAVTEDEIYLIYWREDYDEELESEETDDYVYMGEHAVRIDRKTYQITDLEIDHVIALNQISDDEIVYYAHDDIDGYYFSVYDCKTHDFGEKVYNDALQYTFGFAVNTEDNTILSTDFATRRLVMTTMEQSGSKAEFLDRIVVLTGNDIQYERGNCYVLNGLTKDIVRVDCKEALENNNELVFYRTMSMEEPYGCGYSIRTEMLGEEEFALSVMAGNTSYDMCMMDTGETKAAEIREKGAFYPLNDVPGVKEYLENCHDYIKDAATNENGEIWMLPIAVDIPFLLYNADTCEENGIQMDSVISYAELLEAADHLYENPTLRDWYSLNGYQIQQDMIDQYNEEWVRKGEKVEYDTREFKTICELMKEHSASDDESLHTWVLGESLYAADLECYFEQQIFALKHYYEIAGYDELPYTMLRAKQLPGINDSQIVHYGTCTCLSVNPNSGNLESTLQYISAYCRYMMGREDTYLLKDHKNVPYEGTQLSEDLYSIYENGGITFEFPEEIFWDTYYLYQNGEADFTEMAEELRRKVSMYLYE